MANGVRVLLRPVLHKVGKQQVVSGVTFGLEIFGKGPGELAKGQVKPAKLLLHGAFLEKARDESKKKPSYSRFAVLSGKIELKAGKPVFTLDAAGKFDYDKPEPAKPTFRRIRVKYETPAFAGAPPVPPAPKPNEQPPEPHPLTILRLPEEPKKSRFLVVGAELEIDGKKSSEIDTNDKLDVPLTPIRLLIRKLDAVFAPSVETLDIKYSVGGLVGSRVTLEITSKNYAAGPIFKRLLTDDELLDGLHTIQWDGKCNPASGDLKDHFLNPLFGPYELKLSDGAKHETKGEFKVLYHSLGLKRGEWTPDGKEPPKATKQKDWAQYKLNQLGYFGGPVGHDFDDYLKKAVIRYKANHKNLHQLVYANYNDTITADVETALAAGDNKHTYIDGDALTNPKGSSKIYVEAITYEDKAGSLNGEFPDAKAPHEKDRINRPMIPVAIDVFLLGKAKKKVLAPQAVGKARVNFRYTDVREDLGKQYTSKPAEPSKTKVFIEKALKLKGGRSGTAGPDNCHKDFGGIRDTPATDWDAPFLVGTSYEPFEVKKDGGQKVCFAQAYDDATKFKDRVGQAGFYFRPSNVAGDAYRLAAEIDFTDLPNAADLDKLHGTKTKRIQTASGKFEIWRRAKVAVQLTWPPRTNSNQWAQIRTEFDKAFLDLDVSSIDVQPVTTFLSDAEYKAIVTSKTAHPAASVSLDANSLVGVALPAQGAQNAAAYQTLLTTFAVDNFYKKVRYELRAKLSANIRKKHPVGFVIIEFLVHKPVNIQTAPPANTAVTPANTNFVLWAGSIGMSDSLVFADQKDPDKVYYVVSHEMGHNFWLKHWEHSGGIAADHDTNDHNCTMSYSSNTCAHPFHKEGVYTPHFCGKCNLKLRGWDIDNPQMPAHS